ncbi:MAG TPA: hypothetical protein VGW12_00230 [Pyrinomonadaceae bacterium]|nr:hypothetical protein [Pyrinomonadaceae bacterium]
MAVEGVLESLRSSLPDIIPQSQKNLIRMLQSVRGLYVRRSTDTKRGRPARFPREHLLLVDSTLRTLLARETSIGVRSFVGQYLSILEFPGDVQEPLEQGEINLFEAHQLARVRAVRLGCSESEARSCRRKLLEAHRLKQEPGARLRERVMEVLGEVQEPDPAQTEAIAVAKADELLEANPLDSGHLFFEELRRIGRALREIKPEELTEEDVDELMPAVDEVSTALMQMDRRRRQKRQAEMKKIEI